MSRKLALNLVVGLAGCVAFVRLVAVPLYRLLHLGLKPHGNLLEDAEFYYLLVSASLIHLGAAIGIAFCLLGFVCALGTPLGFAVSPGDRRKARLWLWYAPWFCFSLELIGRFQQQRWYAEHGLIFPFTAFLRDFAPHLWWLLAAGLLTAPAILTGRGLYCFLLPTPPPPSPQT